MKVNSLIVAVGAMTLFFGIVISCGPSKIERCEAARQDSMDKIENFNKNLPSETEAISLIKYANQHKDCSLSNDLKAACDKSSFGNDTFLKFGDYPDCVPVEDPEIKIFKILPVPEEGVVTVTFDFMDKDAPQMGWISKQDYNKKICAMDFVLENEKWVVDDFYEAWDATIDSFDKMNASSFKSNKF